jgi:alkanesulfonate monooxygenase SsuD/methylene tetrahydromethanopterin reductase-like flavin-dependent oxidoreductase (luciferase family)
MAMATLDQLSGGNRVICGIGVSGSQIVEGWYGQPWGKPYYRIKDYVAIMKKSGPGRTPLPTTVEKSLYRSLEMVH